MCLEHFFNKYCDDSLDGFFTMRNTHRKMEEITKNENGKELIKELKDENTLTLKANLHKIKVQKSIKWIVSTL